MTFAVTQHSNSEAVPHNTGGTDEDIEDDSDFNEISPPVVKPSKEEQERLDREAEPCHLLVYNPVKYEPGPFNAGEYVTFPPFTRQMFSLYWTIIGDIEVIEAFPEYRSSRFRRLVTQPVLKYARSAPRVTGMNVIAPRIWEYLPKSALEHQLCHAFVALERRLYTLTQVSAPKGERVRRTEYGIWKMCVHLVLYSQNLRSQDRWLLKFLNQNLRKTFEEEYIDLQQQRCSRWEAGLKKDYGTATLENFQQFMVDRILDACDMVDQMIDSYKSNARAQTINTASSRGNGVGPRRIKSTRTVSKGTRQSELPSEELDANDKIRLSIIYMHFNELWYDRNIDEWYERLCTEVCWKPFTAGRTFSNTNQK